MARDVRNMVDAFGRNVARSSDPAYVAGLPAVRPAPDGPARDPDREEATGFDSWVADGIDSMVIVPRASTHLDYTDEPPVLPASALGQAVASYYVQAWLAK